VQWSCGWDDDGPGPVREGCDGEPDLTLGLSRDDALSVQQGQLPPSVAFMQGRLKTSGDNELLLRVLAWTATPAFQAALATWAGELSQLKGPATPQ
jgi:putative sterol carrier protein